MQLPKEAAASQCHGYTSCAVRGRGLGGGGGGGGRGGHWFQTTLDYPLPKKASGDNDIANNFLKGHGYLYEPAKVSH